MTDNTIQDEPNKRGPGRPRKDSLIEREPISAKWKMRATPNWETMNSDEEDTPDRYRIDPSLVPEGMSLQWVTTTVLGQDFSHHRTKFERKGWTPVHQEDFDGRFDGMFAPKGRPGEIAVDGLVLMARPQELTDRAKQKDRAEARERVLIKEQSLRGGDMPVTLDTRDGRYTKISKSYERIDVPSDRS